jgi:glycosyltransferase involved in cell wall biosynthesis
MGIHEAFLQSPIADLQPSEVPAILSTRTLREEPYSISTLIRAMKLIAEGAPDARCTIAGDGPDRARYESLTRELGLERVVRFEGWADPQRLAHLLRGHRIYVSVSRADGASVSLFEAMAAGAYPVVSDIDANREWIRDGDNGRLVPPGDPVALAATITRALGDPADMLRAIETNRATARERFSWPGVARRFELIYLDLLSRPSRID